MLGPLQERVEVIVSQSRRDAGVADLQWRESSPAFSCLSVRPSESVDLNPYAVSVFPAAVIRVQLYHSQACIPREEHSVSVEELAESPLAL